VTTTGAAQLPALVGRTPTVRPQALVAALAPPPRFDGARFSTYLPDPGQPSQAAAVAELPAFAATLRSAPARSSFWRRSKPPVLTRPGRYIDGGYGVGKTHLLAALWHVAPAPKAYCTFVELTHIVGELGFATAVEAFAQHTLLAIDEFELDDVGDTVLISTLLARLVASGVRLAVTSNTLPERLGEGRFAAQDFLREIQGLSRHFATVRIDGDDYRHRGLPAAPMPIEDGELRRRAAVTQGATLDDFPALCAHLESLHPVKYGDLLEGVRHVFISGVQPVADQATALRLVVLVDRLYDREIAVTASGVPLDEVFPAAMLKGGYRKKYLRAISRLTALARES
jgi:cell division protein ZapE